MEAFIIQNVINLNEVGIEIINNESHVFENDIERSHKNGIQITYTDRIAPEDYKSDDDEEEVRRKNVGHELKKATRIWKNNIN